MKIELPEELMDDVGEKLGEKLGEYRENARTAGISPPDDPRLLEALARVFAFSDFVSGNVIREPALLRELIDSGDLRGAYDRTAWTNLFSGAESEASTRADLVKMLRRRRRREMIRIAWRDLAGWADLPETMADLTNLADACIRRALFVLQDGLCDKYGAPLDADGRQQGLVVLGMGKLGGGELNFSSDIDLIFGYPEGGRTIGGMDIAGFFARLARGLVKTLGERTAEGCVFRVDVGLRPYGDAAGPMAMSFDAMEEYYQLQGREWERYALIKARVAAESGETPRGDELIERLRPFVYRRYLDFGVFESLRDMKRMISREVERKGMRDNIKLGPGGIREIEFFGQMFQLLRGGVTPVLRKRAILDVLPALKREKYISPDICRGMMEAYHFLRRTENRLQMASDRQTHSLPSDPAGRLRLAVSMGFDDVEAFERRLRSHMEFVHEHFNGLLSAGGSDDPEGAGKTTEHELDAIWRNQADESRIDEILTRAGFENPDAVRAMLARLREDPATRALSVDGLNRLNRLVPRVMEQTGEGDHPDVTLDRILDLIRTIQRRTAYLSLLLENPSARSHLVTLADASSWITSFLSRHPVLLDELLDPRELYEPPQRAEMREELAARLKKTDSGDLEQQIEELCIFKQVNILRVAAADVTGELALMRVSDYLTDIAETVLEGVVELAWRHMTARHGEPIRELDGKPVDKGFAIIAYGKLGGLELGYGSDLDLVFLHAGAGGVTDGEKRPIANTQFYARLSQRIIHILTAHTRAGRLYETDMRLRPDGGSGLVVSHVDSFEEYQEKKAWTWEHQALVRARPVVGDRAIAGRFEKIRRETLSTPRPRETLMEEVREMRERLRRQEHSPKPGLFDLKQGPGGMVDIEFLVQYLLLLESHRHPELLEFTDNIRQLQTLIEAGVMDNPTADFLKHAYLITRAYAHKLSLQDKPARVPDTKFPMIREKVMKIWKSYMEAS